MAEPETDDKKDLKSDVLDFEALLRETPEATIRAVYAHVEKHAHQARQWYWSRLAPKRAGSFIVRILAFLLGGAGSVAPVCAAIWSDTQTRLAITQAGVAALVVAGLVLLADRLFGWSSGWLRYMSTALAMERVTQQFRLEWGAYMLAKSAIPPTKENARELFDIARRFHESIDARVREETEGWVAEFANSMAAFDDLLRRQRESAEQAVIQVTADQKKALPGALQIAIRRSATTTGAVQLFLDGEPLTSLTGNVWAVSAVAPGLHVVSATTGETGQTREARKAAQVQAGAVAAIEIEI